MVVVLMLTRLIKRLMLTPLDTIQRHSFLHQLPQRTQLPQEADPLRYSLHHVVDLAFRCETPDTEPDTTVCAFVAVAKRAENIAGFEGGGCAGASGREGNVFEGHEEGFAFNVCKGNVDAAGVEVVRVAVLRGVFEGEEAFEEAVGECFDAFGVILRWRDQRL